MQLSRSLTIAAFLLSACVAPTELREPAARAILQPASGSQVSGTVTLSEVGTNRIRITGELSGHSPGRRAFHIHEKGDCSAHDAMSAAGHFNPAKTAHGASPTTGHAGDLGNITFDSAGRATVDLTVQGISLGRDTANGVIGRALMVHMQEDDLKTDPTGNAGARVACGMIG